MLEVPTTPFVLAMEPKELGCSKRDHCAAPFPSSLSPLLYLVNTECSPLLSLGFGAAGSDKFLIGTMTRPFLPEGFKCPVANAFMFVFVSKVLCVQGGPGKLNQGRSDKDGVWISLEDVCCLFPGTFLRYRGCQLC